jgi:hypothetical protein
MLVPINFADIRRKKKIERKKKKKRNAETGIHSPQFDFLFCQ